jgi:toxin ParE1/3/4
VKVVKTAQAQEDLFGLWATIAADSPAAADRLLDQVDARLKLLSAFPEMGASREELRAGLRNLVIGEYVALYRVLIDEVEIVRVVHGRRDFPGLFT